VNSGFDLLGVNYDTANCASDLSGG